jgi:hypothetical protein
MRLVSDIENGLPKTEAPSRSKSPTNWQAPPDRDRGPSANPRHCPTFCRERTHRGERLYAWLTTQSGANPSRVGFPCLSGRIQGIFGILGWLAINHPKNYVPLQRFMAVIPCAA